CLVELRATEPVIPMRLFRNRTFNAASAVGFVIGFTMFGAIVYLPLYLQIVHGASPTKSGLELLPMVLGMLTTFIVSGQLVSRTGRYKIFPIAGSAVTALGLDLMAHLGPPRPSATWRSTWWWWPRARARHAGPRRRGPNSVPTTSSARRRRR
ncbi:multidrug-efflux transporter, partial [mine drainage metagenome]